MKTDYHSLKTLHRLYNFLFAYSLFFLHLSGLKLTMSHGDIHRRESVHFFSLSAIIEYWFQYKSL